MSDKIEWLDRTLLRMPYVTLCLNEKQYLRAVKHLKVKDPDLWVTEGCCASVHRFSTSKGLCCIVCLDVAHETNGIEITKILVHEAIHVWQRYKDYIGETSPGREIEAYAIEQITGVLMYSYVKQMKLV